MKMSSTELRHMQSQIDWVLDRVHDTWPMAAQLEPKIAAAFARAIVVGLQDMEPLVPPTIQTDQLARWFQRELDSQKHPAQGRTSMAEARKIAKRLQDEVVLSPDSGSE